MAARVFVDIDTQFDFMDPRGKLYVPGAEAIRENLRRLSDHAREHGIPWVASADAHPEDDPEFATYGFPPHCVKGTAGQKRIPETARGDAMIVAKGEPAPEAPAIVCEKQAFDIFDNPAADAVFDRYRGHEMVVYGVATDYCVRAAALGLRERGFPVVVVSDAIAAVSPEGEAKATDEMKAAGVRFTTVAEIISDR